MPLGSSLRTAMEVAVSRYQATVEAGAEYLEARGITRTSWISFRLGVVVEPEPGHEEFAGRLCIPYLTRSGVVNLKFRCLQGHDCKEAGCPKYLGLHGVAGTPRLYNVGALFKPSRYLAVCEGEPDTIVLDGEVGVPTVGFPGVDTWRKCPHWRRCLSGYEAVFVPGHGDKPGRETAQVVANDVQNGFAVNLPDGEDINSLFLREGADGIRRRLGL